MAQYELCEVIAKTMLLPASRGFIRLNMDNGPPEDNPI